MAKATGKVKTAGKSKPVPPSQRKAKAAPKAAAKAAPKAKAAGTKPRHDRVALSAKVVELREGGMAWGDIATATGADVITVRDLHTIASVRPKDRIKGTDSEVAKAIVSLRDGEHLPWMVLAARSGLTKAKVKAIYSETSGKPATGGPTAAQARAAERAESEPKAAKSSKAKGESPRVAAKANRTKRVKAGQTRNPS